MGHVNSEFTAELCSCMQLNSRVTPLVVSTKVPKFFAHFREILPISAHFRENFAHFRENFAHFCENFAHFRENFAHFREILPTFVKFINIFVSLHSCSPSTAA